MNVVGRNMWRRINVICMMFFLMFVVACSENFEEGELYPYGHYKDDEMIGTVWEVNKDENLVIVDISEWEKRDRKGPDMTDEGYEYVAKIDDNTIFAHENGNEASLDVLKKGQKVLVNPPRGDSFSGYAEEIILLEMTDEEKYWRMLAQIDGFNIVVMYKSDQHYPQEMEEILFENATKIMDEKNIHIGASWIPYNEDFVVDYKEELEIEQFPVIMVFDTEGMIFKGYEVEELYEFLRELEE